MNLARAALILATLPTAALAQNLRVVPVPFSPLDITVSHQAYNGHATTFKAIARGGSGSYLFEWDFNGDGAFDFSDTTTNRYNLSARYSFPNQAAEVTFNARVRVTSGGQTVTASYPVRVFPDVPLNPATANERQLQLMRNVAIDDALWYLHNSLVRSGNEEDPLFGAQATANLPGNFGTSNYNHPAMVLEALVTAGHYPAFPPAYLGAMPNPSDNAWRWNTDPYAEDAMRLVNRQVTLLTSVSPIPAVDEANNTGFYPEANMTPLPGTDDGVGLGNSFGNVSTATQSTMLRALSKARLTGFTAQVGDPNFVLNKPFAFIIQQMVDALVFAQSDAAFPGGWDYWANSSSFILSENGYGFLDAVDALMVTERLMGPSGVIVNNRLKSRAVAATFQLSVTCAQGGSGGTYFGSGASCEFSTSAGHTIALGWLGANLMSTADSRLAFPGQANAVNPTRGQLRSLYDAKLTFIGNTFSTGAPGMVNWDTAFVTGGNFARLDGEGNHNAMLLWSRAARAVEPEVTLFGANDFPRLFSQYLINNQASNGGWNWVYANNANTDSSWGEHVRAAIAAMVLMQKQPLPVAWGTASPTTLTEGDSVAFTAQSTQPGGVFVWSFGNGATAGGASVSYPYPDNGQFNATITHTTAGGVGTGTVAVTVLNAPPVPNAGADRTVDEGTPVALAGSFTDPGAADTHTSSWTFSSGAPASSADVTRTWADDGVVTATFRVTDDDGASAADSALITVANVKPTITSTPGAVGSIGVQYDYTLTFTDPGAADTHTCSAPLLPAGATFTNCALSWTPSALQSAAVTLCVTDDDGGQSCQTFPILVGVVDTDSDGLPDAWEQAHFGNLNATPTQDGDADGLNNAAELAGATNPTVFDGPTAPTIAGAQCGLTVTDSRPTLTLTNATDPQGDVLRYDFEVYSDAALTQLDVAAFGVPAGTTTTNWRTSAVMTPGSHHWRARAHDGKAYGPWSTPACAFTVPAVNQLPSAPSISAPANGSKVSTLTPALEVGNATDPDGDALTYEFELYRGATRERAQANVAQGAGTTSWTVTPALLEEGQYTWRARAVSPGGAGPWSVTSSFGVNAANTAPPVPALVSPQNGTRADSLTPRFSFVAAADADGDALTFDWELSADNTFANALASDAALASTSTVAPSPLTEDTRYCWRVRSDDGQATSAWASACFVVSASDSAPGIPTQLNPASGVAVPTRTPVFSWTSATDPEGAPVTYDVEVKQGGAVVATLTGVTGNTAQLPVPLDDGKVFTWRVRASAESVFSDYSVEVSFEVKVPEPTSPQGCHCVASPGASFVAGVLLLALRRRRRG